MIWIPNENTDPAFNLAAEEVILSSLNIKEETLFFILMSPRLLSADTRIPGKKSTPNSLANRESILFAACPEAVRFITISETSVTVSFILFQIV